MFKISLTEQVRQFDITLWDYAVKLSRKATVAYEEIDGKIAGGGYSGICTIHLTTGRILRRLQ